MSAEILAFPMPVIHDAWITQEHELATAQCSTYARAPWPEYQDNYRAANERRAHVINISIEYRRHKELTA